MNTIIGSDRPWHYRGVTTSYQSNAKELMKQTFRKKIRLQRLSKQCIDYLYIHRSTMRNYPNLITNPNKCPKESQLSMVNQNLDRKNNRIYC